MINSVKCFCKVSINDIDLKTIINAAKNVMVNCDKISIC